MLHAIADCLDMHSVASTEHVPFEQSRSFPKSDPRRIDLPYSIALPHSLKKSHTQGMGKAFLCQRKR